MATEYCEVLDELFDIGGEVFAACRAGEYVRCSEIHQAVLTEGVSALQDPGNPVFIIIGVKANGAGDIHCVVDVVWLERVWKN